MADHTTRSIDRREVLRRLVVGAGAAAGASLVAGCSGATVTSSQTGALPPGNMNQPAGGGPVTVALLLPLSGGTQTAIVAKAMKQAAELALFERNTPNLQLVVKDDKGSEAGAKQAAEDAIKGGAQLIIGPLFSRSTAAAAPIARQAGVPVVSFSNDPAVAGNGVYLLSFLVEQEVQRIVAYAAAQGRRRLAALLPSDAYGKRLELLLRAEAQRSGVIVAAVERYPLDAAGMVAPTKRIKAAIKDGEARGEPIDALFLPGAADTLSLLAPLLPYLQIDTQRTKLLGTGGWDDAVVSREKALTGGWFAAPDPRGWRELSVRFAKSYGAPPPRLASLAYDAMGVAAAFAGTAGPGRFAPQNLMRASGFNGVDGPFRFAANGHADRSLAVLEVRGGTSVVIDAAASGPGAAPQLTALGVPAPR